MSEDVTFRCAYCGRSLANRNDIPQHEAHCDLRLLKKELWRLLKAAAYARERQNGKHNRTD